MARTGGRRVLLAVALACAGWAGMGQAEEFTIQSFSGTGKLVFNELSTATVYRVEWAPTPAGPWTNFTGAAGARLDAIAATGSGSVTCSVPMCYRVVAAVTNASPAVTEGDYLVVDLSGGPSASSYPVSYLAAVPGGGWTDEHKTTKLVLRRLPATAPDFTMGSPSGEMGRNTDETQHTVTLSQGFYVCVFEVTQKQWERVTGLWPSYFDNASYRDARPVEQVSYNAIRGSSAGAGWPASGAVDASSFLGLLRARTGLAFDLPTEAQWEYACRAGTTTALNSGYNLTSTGQDARMDAVGRYWYNGGSGYTQSGDTSDTSVGSAKVGSYLPNAWGLYDMHGNVWQWCLDWYGNYPGTVSDPKGASSGSARVIRGGGWYDYDNACRSANRTGYPPDGVNFHIGFRVALPPGQQ